MSKYFIQSEFKNNKGIINERNVTVTNLSTLIKNICYVHFVVIVRLEIEKV
jgi:hypothetical protein